MPRTMTTQRRTSPVSLSALPVFLAPGKNAEMQQPDDASEHVTQMHQKLVEEAERERDEPAREEQVRELVERFGPQYQQ
jgi:hypothetical protein